MGFLSKILGKEKRNTIPQELGNIFNKNTKQDDMFNELKKIMNTENQKVNVDGPSNPNYGLSASNPVFVKGAGGTNLYLSRLRTPSEQKLIWNRLGSINSDGIPGCTDIYKGKLNNNSDFIQIFVNWYGKSNATIAPKGLKIM